MYYFPLRRLSGRQHVKTLVVAGVFQSDDLRPDQTCTLLFSRVLYDLPMSRLDRDCFSEAGFSARARSYRALWARILSIYTSNTMRWGLTKPDTPAIV